MLRNAKLLVVLLASGLTAAACDDDDVTGTDNVPAEARFAIAYINPDAGLATANPTVTANSSCATPDRSDQQQVSDAGSTARNVHIDACLSSTAAGTTRFDGPVSFETSGVGVISACPDADGASGPKTSLLAGSRCTHSGFEAANTEYHVRVNSTTAGTQTVTFCYDPERDGCANAPSRDVITVQWM